MAEKRRPKGAEDPTCPMWMVSFSDMMSLMMTFFVMLVTFSTPDQGKLAEVYGALRGAFGVTNIGLIVPTQTPSSRPPLRDSQEDVRTIDDEHAMWRYDRMRSPTAAIEEQLEALGLHGMIKLDSLEEGISIKLLNPLMFYRREARLTPEGERALALMAEVLVGVHNQIRVVGFPDADCGKPEEDAAWRLATARAAAVAVFLSERGKVAPKRISITGWTGDNSAASRGSLSEREANCAAEILVLAKPRDRVPSAQEVIVTDDWD